MAKLGARVVLRPPTHGYIFCSFVLNGIHILITSLFFNQKCHEFEPAIHWFSFFLNTLFKLWMLVKRIRTQYTVRIKPTFMGRLKKTRETPMPCFNPLSLLCLNLTTYVIVCDTTVLPHHRRLADARRRCLLSLLTSRPRDRTSLLLLPAVKSLVNSLLLSVKSL